MLTYTGHSGSFRGNGVQDLLTRNYKTGELFVHPGTGRLDGLRTYGEPVLVGTGFAADHHVWVGAGDFTGDGTADVFALTIEKQAYIYLNTGGLNGTGTLAEPIHVGGKLPDITYDTIALADLDGDGKTDIIGRQEGTSLVDTIPFTGTVNGTNSFGDPFRLAEIGEHDIPLGAADITGDGEVDLLVLHPDGGLSALETATGTWHRISEGWGEALIIDVTDVTGDGRPDLLALGPDGSLLAHVNTGNPDQVFAPPVVVAKGWTDFNAIS
ncbi:VCBS repeat-containing protein [Allokutzneria sp. A3M-2-11 16]|uniref:FG-GAP repeat domain-containing protein n=1 Tax=Allokutzneria sp. A3M-2-11 16 TaxID=2962043 RepID=UPI0020B7671C|nr:VCBS repeat-containing protein [Allokutzneria sp. A3M-2-11 16]MCP3803251.1 VCBS repeat-containing protein [Allokutzneria sp. A3M-2-11 16]